MGANSVSKHTLQRLPQYLHYLRGLDSPTVSATAVAAALGLHEVQVRKDLAEVSNRGRPKVGYITSELTADLETFLGCNKIVPAILVGAGNLGRALMLYEGFREYGLEIVAAFDRNAEYVGDVIGGKQIYSLEEMNRVCSSKKVRIGIITVGAASAQDVCDMLTGCGIQAIWNFTPAHLTAPEGVLVQNENMACSLAVLSKHLEEKIKTEKTCGQ